MDLSRTFKFRAARIASYLALICVATAGWQQYELSKFSKQLRDTNTSSKRIRKSVHRVKRVLGETQAFAISRECLGHPDFLVRANAIAAITLLHDKDANESARLLVQSLEDPNDWVATCSARAICRSPSMRTSATSALERTLCSGPIRVCDEVINALGPSHLGLLSTDSLKTYELRKRMQWYGNVDFVNQPLRKIITELNQMIDHEINVDWEGIYKQGVTRDTIVTLRLGSARHEEALRELTSGLELDFQVTAVAINIHSPLTIPPRGIRH